MNINVMENMTTSVGMNQSDTVGMNRSQSIGLNAVQSVGAMKMTSVVGDASVFITGKLTEMIEGDVHSETKMERNEYAAEVENSSSNGTIHQNAKVEVKNNSGEKSNNY